MLDYMARTFGSWLSGPPPSEAGDATQGPNDFPGQRLGLPQGGAGSLVGVGRRIVALILDWFIAYGLASLAVTFGLVSSERFLGSQIGSTAVMGVWLVLGVVGGSAVRVHAGPVRTRDCGWHRWTIGCTSVSVVRCAAAC